jgi:hypothetical protein
MKKAWPSRGSRKNLSSRNLFCHPLPISSALSPFLVTSVSLTCSFPLPPSSARSLILSSQSFPAPLLLTSVVYSPFPVPTLLISFSLSFLANSSAPIFSPMSLLFCLPLFFIPTFPFPSVSCSDLLNFFLLYSPLLSLLFSLPQLFPQFLLILSLLFRLLINFPLLL